MENNERSISKEVIFEIEDKAFSEGDFRMTYKAAEGGFRKAYKAKSYDESFRGNHGLLRYITCLRRKPLKR